jgi:hypothetical protein
MYSDPLSTEQIDLRLFGQIDPLKRLYMILFKKVCKVQKDDFCENNLTKTQNELYTLFLHFTVS